MATGPQRGRGFLLLWLLWATAGLQGATKPIEEDVHLLAEHLAEAIQDVWYFAMPWPLARFEPGKRSLVVSLAVADVDAGFATAGGALLSIGATRAWSPRWTTGVSAFFGEYKVSGGKEFESVLTPRLLSDVPLDLPEKAVFTNPTGTIRHSGITFLLAHELPHQNRIWIWDLVAALSAERLDMKNYAVHYRLTGGADAGTEGSFDHSVDNNLGYLIAGIQGTRPLGQRFTIAPRISVGVPILTGDYVSRLTGPGFDMTTESTGTNPRHIGDHFATFGMALRDLSTNLEFDLGAVVGYPISEVLAHPGVDWSLMASLTWRGH